ncbi:MAG: Tol-Pal system beta propeller repeat protein TolB [Desulfatibacillaceae bacterium]
MKSKTAARALPFLAFAACLCAAAVFMPGLYAPDHREPSGAGSAAKPTFSVSEARAAEPDVWITIRQPFQRKLPLAVPAFLPDGGDQALEASTTGAELMRETLGFTGFFKIISPEAFIDDLGKGVTRNKVTFANWTAIGAELLITGSVEQSGDTLVVELRFFDTLRGHLLVGKRYKGRADDLRRMVRRFASEIVFVLTGTHGSFNTRISFVSTTPGNKEIFACDFDGHDPEQLTHNSDIAISPAWSSDGEYIAYTAYKQGGAHMYVQNLAKKTGTVIKYKGLNITPAWHPREFILAAALSMPGDTEIYSLTGNGKIIKRLTNNWGIDVSPSWSPDGKEIAFVSNRSGGPQIYILDVETGKARRLTYRGRYNTSPSWSPRGDKIAYAGLEAGEFNIYIIDSQGGAPVALTSDAGNNESPTWSPDGMMIAFSSTREGPSRIYVMTAIGTEQRRLLKLPGEQTEPAWSPRLSWY